MTIVTDCNIRQVYTFDNYHWGFGSAAGVLMLSYTWGDWAYKFGLLLIQHQVESALRMLKVIYKSQWIDERGGMTKLGDIKGTSFTPPSDPGIHPIVSSDK